MKKISAKVIADSITEEGHRLTTVEAVFPRFILSEVNTHRVLSRNSASSRARPVSKVISELLEHGPAYPVKWASEQKGMSGGDEISTPEAAKIAWEVAMADAMDSAEKLVGMGVHKSIVNRILEPFTWHTAILSGTAFENLLDLRTAEDAQPEFRVLALAIQEALNGSKPELKTLGEWHLPYLRNDDPQMGLNDQIKVSAARCARVSYLTHDGRRDIEADIALYERLASSQHMSPLEHPATPWAWNSASYDIRRNLGSRPRLGNFEGWRQHRLDVEAREGYGSYR